MFERFERPVKMVCLALAALLAWQLGSLLLSGDPLAHLKIPALPTLAGAANETNVALAMKTGTNGINVTNRTNMTNGTNLLANSTNGPKTGLTNAVSKRPGTRKPGLPPELMAQMMPGGRRGGGPKKMELPPEVQTRVDRIIESEIFGPVIHPMPMALLGIADQQAFIQATNGQTEAVKVGGELAGIKLLRIGINRVLVETGGEKKELTLFDGIGSESLMPKPTNEPSTNAASTNISSTNAPSTNAPAKKASKRKAADNNTSTNQTLSSQQKDPIMQSSKQRQLKFLFTAVMLSLLLAGVFLWSFAPILHAQTATNAAATATNSTSTTNTNIAPASTNAPNGSTNGPPEAPEPPKLPTDMIQLSFQNMQIDQVLQWLSENTGKSVVKHPQAHSQLTIVSAKKVTRQEAVTMVYRALGMEGFTAIESDNSILIVPTDQELKMNLSPEFLGPTNTVVPGGRQRLYKVFALQHLPAADVTEKVKTVLSKDAVVVTDDRANLLIITDYNDNLAAAAGLLKALDVEKNEDVIVRAINLKNVDAQELSKQLQPLYQKLTGKQSKELIEVSASQNGNTLMVLSSEANFKEIEKFAASLDTSDAQEKVMQTFDLKNADAQDVAKQLQDLGKDQGNSGSPYRYFYFGGGDQNGKDTKKASIVADRRRNAIVVQAPPSAMEGIGKTIAALDEPIKDNNLAPKIIPVENVSAGDIEDVLNELFLKKTTQRPYFFNFDEPDQQVADRDVGRLYGKVRIVSEAAANALIITANSQENLDAVVSVIKELDKPSAAGDTTYHIRLNFGNAQKIANRINILFAKNGSQALRPVNQQNPNNANPQPQQQQPTPQGTPAADDFSLEQVVKEDPYYSWLGGSPDATGRGGSSDKSTDRPVSDLVGRVRVVPDEASSSVLVTANIHLFAQVSKMIEDMDVPPAQVLIDVRLVQVSANYLDQIGVRYSPNGSQVFSGADYQNSLMPSLSGNYQKGFGGNTSINNPVNAGGSSTTASIAQALTSLRSGTLSSSLSMDFLIQFLQQKADATVISEPQLDISDNDLGKLFVGQSIAIPTGSVNPALGGSSTSTTYRNVGVIIEVEPHINDSGDVQLRVRAESSTVDPTQIDNSPVIDAAQFRTELTAKAGETLVLGGIIQKQISDTIYKTPILGDIPGLKYLFSKRDKSVKRTELLVFLRPRVVRTPEQARLLLEEARKSMSLIRDWEKKEEAPLPKGVKNP